MGNLDTETANGIDGTGRCPNCDYKASPGDQTCLMCGSQLPANLFGEGVVTQPVPAASPETRDGPIQQHIEATKPQPEPFVERDRSPVPSQPEPPVALEEQFMPLDDVVEMTMIERRAPITTYMVIVMTVVTIIIGIFVFQASAASPVAAQLFPTVTPLPPTVTFTPTITPFPTETLRPTETPTITPTPAPTDTPQPDRFHSVQAGESWTSLSITYGVSAESIAVANGRLSNSFLVASEEVIIPWPTATPPLVAVTVELDGQTYIADPGDCATMYEVQENDSLASIGVVFNVDFRAILAVNRLPENPLIRPGDAVCIPTLDLFDGELPPTAGPSPTASEAGPAGPQLLFPSNNVFYAADERIALQWAAVKDLADNEWYMVELVDMTDMDTYPYRGLTRSTAFQLPLAWRPTIDEPHRFRWRVSIVTVVGRRSDGEAMWSFDGQSSDDRFFVWQGSSVVPTPTPTITTTPQP